MALIVKDNVKHSFGKNSTGGELLSTMEEIETNTNRNNIAGALAVKELKAEMDDNVAQLTQNIEDIEASFQDGCSTIAAAITSMGVSTASNASPATMAANIKKIDTVNLSSATKAGDAASYTIPKSGKAIIFYTASFHNSAGDDSTHNNNGGSFIFSVGGVQKDTNSKYSSSLGNHAFGWNGVWTGDVTKGQVVTLTTSTGGWFAAFNVYMRVVIL